MHQSIYVIKRCFLESPLFLGLGFFRNFNVKFAFQVLIFSDFQCYVTGTEASMGIGPYWISSFLRSFSVEKPTCL